MRVHLIIPRSRCQETLLRRVGQQFEPTRAPRIRPWRRVALEPSVSEAELERLCLNGMSEGAGERREVGDGSAASAGAGAGAAMEAFGPAGAALIQSLDGSRGYLRAAIDFRSRRIQAWNISASFNPDFTARLLLDAVRQVSAPAVPTAMADEGVGNYTTAVDQLTHGGVLKHMLAQTDVPNQLADAKVAARQARMTANRVMRCTSCAAPVPIESYERVAQRRKKLSSRRAHRHRYFRPNRGERPGIRAVDWGVATHETEKVPSSGIRG